MEKQNRRVTKIEAAEAHLNCAIKLFFSQSDPIPIETLVGAASGILTALAKRHGLQAFIHDSDWIRPEYKREWIQNLHKEQNFFKHADKDPDGILEYNALSFQFLLLEACHLYGHLASDKFLKHRQSVAALLYVIWFGLAHPNLMKKTEDWNPIFLEYYRKFKVGELDPNDFRFFREALNNIESG